MSGAGRPERRRLESPRQAWETGGKAMSEFVFLYRSTEADRREAMGTPERAQKSMQAWLAWMRELETKGHLKSPGQPLDTSGKVVSGKNKIVTDGPFSEAKDIVLGFSVIEASDLAHAAELAEGCPMVQGGGGLVEVRPVRKLEL
jgi:hypothetical protein